MRRNFFAEEAGRPVSFFFTYMAKRTLSIFVDESGRFQYPDELSRFYILSLVFHDQANDLSQLFREFDAEIAKLNLSNLCFHAGPIVRQEKGYVFLNRELRARIFFRMLTFAHRAAIKYHCLTVDKRYVTSGDQIAERLSAQLESFINSHAEYLSEFDEIKVYYDCGQSCVTNLLHAAFQGKFVHLVKFAQQVRPDRYRLFQVADLVCTVKLIEQKLEARFGMTESERAFFGGPRQFKRNVLRQLKPKEMP